MMQTKLLGIDGLQLKLKDDRTFEGYASVFGKLDSYNDSIVEGAYAKTLTGRDRPIKMRWNHYGPVIGKWLKIEEDSTGLFVAGALTPGHSVAEDTYASLKHGSIDGMSIGYYAKQSSMSGDVRYLKEIELFEISVVEEPADNFARIDSVKRHIETASSLSEIEDFLRDACKFSRSDATALVSRVRNIVRGDPAAEAEAIKGLFDSFRAT